MATTEQDLRALAGDGFSGDLILPGEPGYEEARLVFNRMIDRRPAVIARCMSTADVVAAVNFGRDTGLDIAVRCGGHSPRAIASLLRTAMRSTSGSSP
jgi:FAD/FMN-containing dehydrogenase